MSSSEETASDTSRQGKLLKNLLALHHYHSLTLSITEVLLLLPLVEVDRRFRQALSKLIKSRAVDVVAKIRLEAICVHSSVPEILYGADLS